MTEHKQVDNVKRKKLSDNTAYISFFVYNTDVDIHHISVPSSVMMLA